MNDGTVLRMTAVQCIAVQLTVAVCIALCSVAVVCSCVHCRGAADSGRVHCSATDSGRVHSDELAESTGAWWVTDQLLPKLSAKCIHLHRRPLNAAPTPRTLHPNMQMCSFLFCAVDWSLLTFHLQCLAVPSPSSIYGLLLQGGAPEKECV